MCGRGRCTLAADDVPRACYRGAGPVPTLHMDRYRPSHNVAPGSHLPVIRKDVGSDGEGCLLHCMKWGLVPSFTKKSNKPDFFRMFNARSESLAEKASFRRLIPNARCLVAMEGFYEWKKDRKKQPYYIHFRDGRPLVFAALYDCWHNSEGEKIYTFTIITTSSSSALQWLHDRMPVIFGDKASADTWLNGAPSSKVGMVLKPYEAPDLVWYPVTSAIGKLSFDGPECVKEIHLKIEEKNSISKYFSSTEVKNERESEAADKELTEKYAPQNPNLIGNWDHDSKPCVTMPVSDNSKKYFVRQDAAQSTVDMKPANVGSNATAGTPGKKEKSPKKSDHDELSANSQPAKDRMDTLRSPKRQKGNIKAGNKNQATLFSYFSK